MRPCALPTTELVARRYGPKPPPVHEPRRAGARVVPPNGEPNRAARRAALHSTRADVRLLAHVALAAARRRKECPFPSELAATYGLEHEARRMRAVGRLSAADLQRVRALALARRMDIVAEALAAGEGDKP
jgi:hypothetical protein